MRAEKGRVKQSSAKNNWEKRVNPNLLHQQIGCRMSDTESRISRTQQTLRVSTLPTSRITIHIASHFGISDPSGGSQKQNLNPIPAWSPLATCTVTAAASVLYRLYGSHLPSLPLTTPPPPTAQVTKRSNTAQSCLGLNAR